MIKLKKPLYIIRANRKNDLYICFTNEKNLYHNVIEKTAQNVKEFALCFDSEEQAQEFLKVYFRDNKVQEKNKTFYEIIPIYETLFDIDSNVTLYNTFKVYYGSDAYKTWTKNVEKYRIKL